MEDEGGAASEKRGDGPVLRSRPLVVRRARKAEPDVVSRQLSVDTEGVSREVEAPVGPFLGVEDRPGGARPAGVAVRSIRVDVGHEEPREQAQQRILFGPLAEQPDQPPERLGADRLVRMTAGDQADVVRPATEPPTVDLTTLTRVADDRTAFRLRRVAENQAFDG